MKKRTRSSSAKPYKHIKSPSYKKYLIFTLFVLVLLLLFSGVFGLFNFLEKNTVKEKDRMCGDGTLYNSCSLTKPYYCLDGKLIDLSYVCGCPDGFVKEGRDCSSSYETDPRNIRLKYTLNEGTHYLNFKVYKGFEDYISKIPRSISYSPGVNSSRKDFVLKEINEEEQRKFLMPLVIAIQNISNDKNDQMRIAVSIVQNIPFGVSNKTYFFGNTKLDYSRYPYDVLYDNEGICGEKTDLLLFLLREMGYGVSFFYYEEENHEAVGIKCPMEESLMGSEYCFVETTGPSIISDSKITYVGVGKLTSTPQIYSISHGKSLSANLEEYEDAEKLIRIRNSIERTGLIDPIQKKTFDELKMKYGLAEEYYG
jgi:hypothetical protein